MALIKYLVAFIFLTLVFTQAGPKKCDALRREKMIELLGQPGKCHKPEKNVECFGSQSGLYAVQFNDSGLVEQIRMFNGCSGVDWLTKDLDRMAPEKLRGKLLKKTDWTTGSCEASKEEEYECVSINYTQQNCMGCVPASITIVWKTDTEKGQRRIF